MEIDFGTLRPAECYKVPPGFSSIPQSTPVVNPYKSSTQRGAVKCQ